MILSSHSASNSLVRASGGGTEAPEHSKRWFLAKRYYDFFFAGLGLILLSPAFLLIAVLIRVVDGGPVFYRQKRIGYHGQPFEILKFRTMHIGADQAGPAITKSGDQRVTGIGRFLRATKLDELPQLWNVVKGEMSLVGPRPEVPRFVEQYTELQRKILEHQPGITDLATLRFRGEEALLRQADNVEEFYMRTCVPRKIQMNHEYARQANIITDTWIIFQTLCPSRLGMLFLHAVLLVASLWLSFWVHYNLSVPDAEATRFVHSAVWIVPLQAALLFWSRQFSGLLSCFSVIELRKLMGALALALLGQLAVSSVVADGPSTGILITNFVFATFLVGAVRLGFGMAGENSTGHRGSCQAHGRVAIIGAGEPGANVARQILALRKAVLNVAAFFEDDSSKWHKEIHGISVEGMPELLLDPSWRERIDFVLVAMPHADLARVEEIESILEKGHFQYERVPSITQLIESQGTAHGTFGTPREAKTGILTTS